MFHSIFQKLFDLINYDLIRWQLMVYYGFNPTIVAFLQSCLTGRNHRVYANDKLSAASLVISEVLQGLLLGPILLLTYTADLFSSATFYHIQLWSSGSCFQGDQRWPPMCCYILQWAWFEAKHRKICYVVFVRFCSFRTMHDWGYPMLINIFWTKKT